MLAAAHAQPGDKSMYGSDANPSKPGPGNLIVMAEACLLGGVLAAHDVLVNGGDWSEKASAKSEELAASVSPIGGYAIRQHVSAGPSN
jgi:hypothetical protein